MLLEKMNYLCCVSVCLLGISTALTYDKELSTTLNGITNEDVLIFTLKKVTLPQKSLNGTHQILLALGSITSTHMSFILDRKHSKVVVETVIDTKSFREEITFPQLSRPRIGLIIIEIHQKNKFANVYVNCKLLRKLNLEVTIQELGKKFKQLRLHRTSKADISIDGHANILDILEKNGCQSNKLSSGYQSQSNDLYTYNRGDIPVSHADQTTSLLVNTMNDLADTIRQLQVEIQSQREETALLRDTMANCEACKPGRNDYFRS